MTDSQTHLVLVALADPTRRLLFEQLCQQGSGTATSLAAHLPITRQAVTKHLTILAESGLVAVQEAGRERRFLPHPEALQPVTSWIATIEARWDRRLVALRSLLLDELPTPPTAASPEEEHDIVMQERIHEDDSNKD